MDPFGDNDTETHVTSTEDDQDPAAAFFAQERDQLAGLEDDDFDKLDTVTQVRDTDEGSGVNQQYVSGDDNDFLTNGPSSGQGHGQNGFDEEGDADTRNGFAESAPQQWNGAGGMGGGANYEVPKIRPSTPEKIRKWREDQKERLEKKDADEEKKKQEQRAQAQRELQEWYEIQQENVKKAKRSNRDAEKDFVQQRDSDKPGEEWERVSRLCDFNPKSAKGTKDVSRLRSIILQLKQTSS